ncbi:MAG: polyamine aminopropyltransferase [Planctomycetota bacterium]
MEAGPSGPRGAELVPAAADPAPAVAAPAPAASAPAPAASAPAPAASAPAPAASAPAPAASAPAPAASAPAPAAVVAPAPGARKEEPPLSRTEASELGRLALFLSVFLVATCGLIYELVAAAMASYLMGDSVTQFSLVIGCYLSAMGLGSYLSRTVQRDLLVTFIRVEIAVGLLGGFSSLALFLSYAYLGGVRALLFLLVGAIGTLVGLEIPVLMRILKDEIVFSELVARVLAFDYLGALAASLAFPLLFLPLLGLPRTAFAFGLLNTAVALVLCQVFRGRLGPSGLGLRTQALVTGALLLAGVLSAEKISLIAEREIFDAPVLFKEKTLYQTIMVTRQRGEVRLLLDGHLQFSSLDERRYHECLVHPAVAALRGPLRHALILGGGDGMALRELLRYPQLEKVTLVDLDPAMTRLFRDDPMLAELNEGSYRDPRAEVINADAMKWLEEHEGYFDLVIVDFPDPRNHALVKLYTRGMYRLIHRHLARSGAVAIQSTTPYGPPGAGVRRGSRAFWCIARTLEDAGFSVRPYHCFVPSFGEWGYMLATPEPLPGPPQRLAPGARGTWHFLNDQTLPALFAFPEDLAAPDGVEINRLNDQLLLRYYESEWGARVGAVPD